MTGQHAQRASLSEDALAYAASHSTPPSAVLARVARTTREEVARSEMLSHGPVAAVLATLVHATRARHVLEVGTYTGYSAIAMAEALPPGGRLTTCEIDPVHAEIAREHFALSPVGKRIELRLGPALDTIASLPGPFEVVFIDADKGGYRDYYEAALGKLAPNGVIAVDNTLWGGEVVAPQDDSGRALAAFNEHVLADPRTSCVVLPIGDGLTLIRHATSRAAAQP